MDQNQMKARQSLPPAPKTMLAHSWQKCRDAGVNINQDDFVVIHRAVMDYLMNSEAGKTVMLKVLNAETTEGCYTKRYYQMGAMDKVLDYRKIIEFKGWIYNGKSYPHKSIDVLDSTNKTACDHCGGMFPEDYCNQTVLSVYSGQEHLEHVCNHCRLFNANPKIRDTASNQTCEECKQTICQFHPAKDQFKLPLNVVVQGEQEPTLQMKALPYNPPDNPMERYGKV